MSEEIVKRYRVMCIAENKMVTVYSTEAPTLCPNDHPNREIDHARTMETETLKKNQVEIFDPTAGNFQYTDLPINVPSGAPGNITTHDFSWPMWLNIWKTEFVPGSEHDGDEIDVIFDPDRIVGVLTADAQIGSTELTVSSTLFDYPNLTCGLDVTITDGTNTEDVGRITGIDRVNFKLIVENGLSQTFLTGTVIQFNLHMVKNAIISRINVPYTLGLKGIQNKGLPPGIVMRYIYKNKNGQAKNCYVGMEYNYH
jgi:hypothetical protein